MLQFIVLGIIPGTSVQLNFVEILLSTAAVFAVLYLRRIQVQDQRRKNQQQAINLIAL